MTKPEPPYYAVIFTSRKSAQASDGYEEMAELMDRLASEQPGYLGHQFFGGEDGSGVTISYWKDLEAIMAWRKNTEHAKAQARGQAGWYDWYELETCKVERVSRFADR